MVLSLDDHKKGSEDAYVSIKDVVLKTPLLKSDWLSKQVGCNVFLKMESEQITRSFKLRGAANKMLKMQQKGCNHIITASSGNHGLACLYVASNFNIDVSVYTSQKINKVKEDIILSHPNAQLIKFGSDVCGAETEARRTADEKGLPYISPYNDVDVMFGQGTIGVELMQQLPNIDAVFIPVGGGGLAAGIAGYIKSVKPSVVTVGCQPVINSAMYDCIQSGFIKDDWTYLKDTFADGIAGGVEDRAVTFDVCKQHIDKWVLVEEEDIKKGVYDILDNEKKVIEGAAGLTIASLRKVHTEFKDKNVVLIICGGNISTNKLADLFGKFHTEK